ncbi:MAG TPA: deoxyribonuclease V [Candidatus Peribacteraceae bacterium]|nr:deoxyribonuclease V [Candidatus Peribacteraceae bacterium]
MLSIRSVHPWVIPPREAIALQKRLSQEVLQIPLPRDNPARFIAGLDVSSTRFDPLLTAGVVVWDRLMNRVIETASAQADATYPYIPGLLSFREIPVLVQAIEKLNTVPDIFFVDGQGRAHPRRIGIATHIGILLDRPTVGVGKSRLCGAHEEVGDGIGDAAPLIDQDETIGMVIRTKKRSNPLYISVGHRIDLSSSVRLVMESLRGYRLPEPTRLVHNYVNDVRTGVMV